MNSKEIFTTILLVALVCQPDIQYFSCIATCIKMKELQVNNIVATNNKIQRELVGSSFLS